MTEKILSDDTLQEIETRPSAYPPNDDWRETPRESRHVILTVAERDALCATVRALRQQNQELKAIVDIGTSDDPGTALAKVHRIQDEATTALREQLAQRDQLLSDSAETEDRCRDLLAAYDKSSPEGVVPLDEVVRLVVGQLAHWQDRTRERTGEVERLQSQLAQREQEWKAFENLGKRVEADLRAQLAQLTQERHNRPKIICLCGSTRFIEQFAIKTWELEREGFIVLGCTLLPMWYCQVPSHFGEATGTKEQCDELHLRKIDLADEILVLNIGGYIGESTANEIAYATRLGKPVSYVEEQP